MTDDLGKFWMGAAFGYGVFFLGWTVGQLVAALGG